MPGIPSVSADSRSAILIDADPGHDDVTAILHQSIRQ